MKTRKSRHAGGIPSAIFWGPRIGVIRFVSCALSKRRHSSSRASPSRHYDGYDVVCESHCLVCVPSLHAPMPAHTTTKRHNNDRRPRRLHRWRSACGVGGLAHRSPPPTRLFVARLRCDAGPDEALRERGHPLTGPPRTPGQQSRGRHSVPREGTFAAPAAIHTSSLDMLLVTAAAGRVAGSPTDRPM